MPLGNVLGEFTKLLLLIRKSCMIGEIMEMIYLVESVKFSKLHWAN